jgi:hypothetical protein
MTSLPLGAAGDAWRRAACDPIDVYLPDLVESGGVVVQHFAKRRLRQV